jgi:hypothetical protein
MSSEEEELSGLVIKKRKGKEIPQGVIQIELKTWTLARCHVTQSILSKQLR